MRVDLTDYAGESIFAKYSNFSVGPESDNYTLHVNGYDVNSTAGQCSMLITSIILFIF